MGDTIKYILRERGSDFTVDVEAEGLSSEVYRDLRSRVPFFGSESALLDNSVGLFVFRNAGEGHVFKRSKRLLKSMNKEGDIHRELYYAAMAYIREEEKFRADVDFKLVDRTRYAPSKLENVASR